MHAWYGPYDTINTAVSDKSFVQDPVELEHAPGRFDIGDDAKLKTFPPTIYNVYPYHYTKEIVCVRASVCPDGRSPEVALTPRPWLAFRSTEKPGGVVDGRAEIVWTITTGLSMRMASTSSYVGTRESGKIDRHTWK